VPSRAIALALVAVAGCGGARVGGEPPPGPEPVVTTAAPTAERAPAIGWLKGQLHLHSDASGDSQSPPDDVVRWYDAHGYDFVVFTDHNRITEIAGTERMLVMPGIELTANLDTCDPPPEPGLQCLLHVNALFVDARRVARLRELAPPPGRTRLEHFDHARRVAEALGGLAVLNHPNFHYAADAALLGRLAESGLGLVEVANEAVDSNNGGDADHPSTERLWDEVLGAGHRMWGVASDDAHHYFDADAVRARGDVAHVGDRGFVMVRAERDPAAIEAAIARGDFYASSGVLLSRVEATHEVAEVEVAPDQGDVRIVATTVGGLVVAQGAGPTLRVRLADVPGAFVRFTATDAKGKKAWTQPVFR
jgi:hypothetical protein